MMTEERLKADFIDDELIFNALEAGEEKDHC